MSEDDLTLVPRAAGGDELAFEVLVRRHSDAAWRLAFGMLRDRGAAEDAVQETFIKAHRALPDFRGDASFKTWLLSITHRTCLDQLRKARPAVASLDEARRQRTQDRDEATRIALEMAVGTLPDDERQAFMLVDALGLTREEASKILGVPVTTLKSRLARAHDRLVAAVTDAEPKRAAGKRPQRGTP